MKMVLLITILFAVFVLDWLALDDITTGNQPSFFWEYIMLGANIILILLLYLLWKKAQKD